MSQRIARSSTIWLVATLLLVSAPLFPVLPYAVIGTVIFCVYWRYRQLQGRSGEAPTWMKVLLVVFCSINIYIEFKTLVGLAAGASVLVAACSMKLLELKAVRDTWIIMLLSFFVVVTGLLFSQSLLMAGYLLVVLVVIVSAMAGLHYRSNRQGLGFVFRRGAILSAQALPMMLILFLVVPRIPPLWSVPMPERDATTGISDSMTPGDIARLSQSDKLAFRATFEGKVPPPEQRYWRGIVMSHFDGRTWSQEDHDKLAVRQDITEDGLVRWHPSPSWYEVDKGLEPEYRYDIILEPTSQSWLFSLGPAWEAIEDTGVTRNYRLIPRNPVDFRMAYQLESRKRQADERDLPEWMAELNLRLPYDGDREARAYGEALSKQFDADPVKIANALLEQFRSQPFYYTLRPPLLGANTIDEFLFSSRQGFCSHYAGAFVFVMRAAGIPARVVAGYQGGEYKPDDRVIQVRQFDAHAWAEIWVPDRGWVRIDPTAAVSPERVREGLERAVSGEGSFLSERPFSPVRFRHIDLLNTLRLSWEKLEYQWQRRVLGYHNESQEALFRQLFGDRDMYQTLAIVLAGATALFLMIMSAVLLWPGRKKRTAVEKVYDRFCRKMAKKGFERRPGEGPVAYGQRIAESAPELAEVAIMFAECYARCQYGNITMDQADRVKQLKTTLSKL